MGFDSNSDFKEYVPIALMVALAPTRGIFLTTGCRIIAAWAPKRQLPLILLPAGKTTWVKPKDAAAFA